MLTIRIDGDFGKDALGKLAKQARYAAKVALDRTAYRVMKEEEAAVVRSFDKPVSFTRKAFAYTKATKANLTAEVYIKPRQAIYLREQIEGGRRRQKPFEKRLAGEASADGYWVPGQGIKLNAYGNISLATIRQIAAGLKKSGKFAEVFVGVPRGHANAPFGIWARVKRGRDAGAIKPLLIRVAAPNYRKRFDFYGVARRTVERDFAAEFDRALAMALATAR